MNAGRKKTNSAQDAAHAGEKLILTLLSFGNDRPIEAKISEGLTKAVRERGYLPVSGVVPIDPRAEVRRLTLECGEKLAGIAIQPFRPNRELAELLLTPPVKEIPQIIIGQYFYNLQMNACVVDNFGGMHAVTEHLIRLGRRRLAYLGEVSFSTTEHDRYQGFMQACLHHGIKMPPDRVITHYFEADLRERLMHMLRGPEPPDALVCLFDGLAASVLRILKQQGVRVPDDVAVMSFGDDEDIASQCDPPLSTAHHPAEEMGEVAGHQLINQIEGVLPAKRELFVLPVSMRLRQSCGTRPDDLPGGQFNWEIPFSNYGGIEVRAKDVIPAKPARH